MKNMYKVIITQGMDYTENLKQALTTQGIEVILVQKDAKLFLNAINSDIDAVVMELSMKGMDACALIGKAKQTMLNPPKFIVTSADDSEATENLVIKSGAAMYSIKPFDSEMLAATIIKILTNFIALTKLKAEEKHLDIQQIITDVMHQIGVPAHIKGYHYLRKSIILCVQNDDMINAVTKILYPTIANEFDTTPSRVERAIRHAIEVAWDRGDVDILNKYFGYTIHNSRGKPTNSEFIAMISDKLKLKYKERLQEII